MTVSLYRKLSKESSIGHITDYYGKLASKLCSHLPTITLVKKTVCKHAIIPVYITCNNVL